MAQATFRIWRSGSGGGPEGFADYSTEVSEAVALAARERKESRGAHARADYQDKDKAWGTFNLVIRKAKDGSMEIRREPISPIRQDLQDIIKEQG